MDKSCWYGVKKGSRHEKLNSPSRGFNPRAFYSHVRLVFIVDNEHRRRLYTISSVGTQERKDSVHSIRSTESHVSQSSASHNSIPSLETPRSGCLPSDAIVAETENYFSPPAPEKRATISPSDEQRREIQFWRCKRSPQELTPASSMPNGEFPDLPVFFKVL